MKKELHLQINEHTYNTLIHEHIQSFWFLCIKIKSCTRVRNQTGLRWFLSNIVMSSAWRQKAMSTVFWHRVPPKETLPGKVAFISNGYRIQFSSVTQSCLIFCDPMNCSMPGLTVHHQLPESTQTHVHWVGDAIQPSHPLSSPSPPALNLSQHQGHFQWVSSSHQVAEVLEFQLQHQSFQWTPRTDLL